MGHPWWQPFRRLSAATFQTTDKRTNEQRKKQADGHRHRVKPPLNSSRVALFHITIGEEEKFLDVEIISKIQSIESCSKVCSS